MKVIYCDPNYDPIYDPNCDPNGEEKNLLRYEDYRKTKKNLGNYIFNSAALNFVYTNNFYK